MKKLILLITIFIFTVSSFAQEKSFNENITQLMYAKNGMSGVENITAKLSKGVDNNKKANFTTQLNKLKTEFIQSTVAQLKKDYTNDQIVEIYTEFHSDKINYTDQTNNFFAKYRRLKGLFFKSAKELYLQYQK